MMKPHVLFVDDEPSLLRLLRRTAEAAGFVVSVADSGAGVVDRVAAGDIDVVASDYCMPGTDGIDVLAAVRDACPGVGRVLMSGAPQRDLVDRARACADIDGFVSKPWVASELVGLLRSIAERRTATSMSQPPSTSTSTIEPAHSSP